MSMVKKGRSVKQFYVFAAMIFTLLLPALCVAGVDKDGKLSAITTSYVVPQKGLSYCRTCCHKKQGTFSVSVVEKPVPSTEWKLSAEEPHYKWEIVPKTLETRTKGLEAKELVLTLEDSDFPKSFDVSVTVEWTLVDDKGKESKTSATAIMECDAIKYEYDIHPVESVDGRGSGELVDGYDGECQIKAKCCRHANLLDLMLTRSCTAEQWQNEVGRNDMLVYSQHDPLTWQIKHPYWYAQSATSPHCCFTNIAEYVFKLEADGCNEGSQVVKVHLPKQDLCSEARFMSRLSSVSLRNVCHDNQLYKADCVLSAFPVVTEASSFARSQYREKIYEEETIHTRQCRGLEGYGFEDILSLDAVVDGLGGSVRNEGDGRVISVEAESNEELQEFVQDLRQRVALEYAVSVKYWVANTAYIEYEAKRRAGFREAYLYHCCYESKYGRNPVKISKETVYDELQNEAEDSEDGD